jgi:hypothetical protein
MKFNDSTWRNFLLESKEQITEATEEEIEYLGDLLEMPPSALPFDDFFNGKYRMGQTFNATESTGILADLEKWFGRAGWTVYLDESGKKPVLKATKVVEKEYKDKEGNRKQVSKTVDLKLSKIASRIISFINNYENWKEGVNFAINLAQEFTDKIGELQRDEDGDLIGYEELKAEYLPRVQKATNRSAKLIASFKELFGKAPYENWEEDAMEAYRFLKLGGDARGYGNYFETVLAPPAKKIADFLLDGSSLDDLTRNIDNYKLKNYIIYSRHPIDVYRMSDFRGLDSCHSLPSRKGEPGFDQYNVCALAEAHGNGLISYVVTAESMREFVGAEEGQEITPEMIREKLDLHELPEAGDGEIFADEERDIEGMVPVSRVRIKNVSYDSNGDDNPIKLLVPQGNVYGQKVPGYVEHLYKTTVEAQKEKIEAIKEKEGDSVNMYAFTRYGGSYQDGGYRVKDALPRMFKIALPDVEISFIGSINYDNDMERELAGEVGFMNEAAVQEIIEQAVENLGVTSNIDINYEVDQYDDTFNISIGCTVEYLFEISRETGLTYREAAAATDLIDSKLENFGELLGSQETLVSNINFQYVEDPTFTGYKVLVYIDEAFLVSMTAEEYWQYEEIAYQLERVFGGDGSRYGLGLGFDSLATRGGPMQQVVYRALQDADLLEGGNEYKFGEIAANKFSADYNPPLVNGDFEIDFELDYDNETGEPMSAGYRLKGMTEYQRDEEEGIKIAALLNLAYVKGDESAKGLVRNVVYEALGGEVGLRIPVDKMRIYFQLEDEDEDQFVYQLGWYANEYDFNKKSDIEDHLNAIAEDAYFEGINDHLVDYIDNNIPLEKLGIADVIAQMDQDLGQTPSQVSFDDPEPEQGVTESKRRVKLRILRG